MPFTIFGTIVSFTLPDSSGITSTESVKDAPSVKFDPRIITFPPCITSTSVDLSKRNLIN